ncbi:MAG: tetratricopeptide repeat protein [Desulfobacterium sp.]|nr:tetratricopeptide repeat protein [Desulfobacterium sp.]
MVIGLVLLLAIPMIPFSLSARNIQDTLPFSTMITLDRAQKLVQEEKMDQAMEMLEAHRSERKNKEKPVHPFLLFTLGNYYMEANKASAAALSYESALKQAPDFAPAWLNLARARYDLQRFKGAGESFINGYDREEKKRGILLYYAANAYFSAKAYPDTLVLFDRLFRDHKEEMKPRWRELLVHALLAENLPEKALPHMEFLAATLGGKVKTQWQETLLYHYMTLKMDAKALEYVQYLTREYPLEPRWWKGLARFNLDKNRLKKALVAMTIYSYLTPLTDSETQLLADLNLHGGIPVQAVDLFQGLARTQSRPGLVKKIVAALQQMNCPDKALEAVDQGIRDHETSMELKMIKGNLLFAMERYPEAQALFNSLAKEDSSGRAWLMLGYSQWNLGELKHARRAMEKAATFKQQKKAARRALKTLPHS